MLHTTITVRVSKKLRNKIELYCKKNDITISQLIRRYLRKLVF